MQSQVLNSRQPLGEIRGLFSTSKASRKRVKCGHATDFQTRRITPEMHDKKLKQLKARQQELNILLEEHTDADESYIIAASTVLNLAKRALEIFESSEVPEKRALLNFLLQNSVVDGKTPAFSLRSPFDTILSLANQPTGLAWQSAFRTFDWGGAVGDPDLVLRQITELLSLV